MIFYKLFNFVFISLFMMLFLVFAQDQTQFNPVIDADYPSGNILTYKL